MRSLMQHAMRAGVAAIVIAMPIAASAQQQSSGVARLSVSAARADALHAKATAFADSLDRLARAARLHEQSAMLRPTGDPMTSECLREAGLLQYYAGNRMAAVRLLAAAARLATERGDVVSASRSYSDAAIVAQELGQPATAWEYGLRAETLTASPLLGEAQRQELRARNVRLERRAVTVSSNHP